jgi:hypothetical protein
MPDFLTGAIGGSALLGVGSSLIGSSASKNASDAQLQATRESNALQKYIYEQNMAEYGQNADTRDQYAGQFNQATGEQKDLINNYLDQTAWGGSQTYPNIQAGQRAISGYENLLNQPQGITENPGYQFRLGEGTKAVQRGAAARSGVLGGAAQKALLKYGQDYATNEYDSALKRYLPLIQSGQTGVSQLQGFQGLTGQGVNQMGNANSNYLNLANLYGNAANAFTSSGNQYANAVGQNNQYGANAQASGYINQANALTGGIQSGMNNALMGYYLGNNQTNQNNANLANWTNSYFGW